MTETISLQRANETVACGSTLELAERMRDTSARVRIAGAGTWMNSGRAVQHDEMLSTANISGVVEYVAGDLTMTVRAGTTLAELDAVTGSEGQWMGIDPAGSNAGTIGATVATASYGPLAYGIGRMRDIVLGIETVTGDGRIVRSGGKVVKNVAGFDLVRLQTGAWGTLGVLTEISLRLRALPEVDTTVAVALDARKPLSSSLILVRDLPIAPLALELVGAPLAKLLQIGGAQTLVARVAGNETRVNAQLASLATFGTLSSVTNSVWHTLRNIENSRQAVVRVSHLPTELHRTWSHVHETLAAASLPTALARATVGRGAMRAVIPHPTEMSDADFDAALVVVAPLIAPPGGHAVWEQLPVPAWNGVPSAVADGLSTGLQRAFDPQQRCNVGILGTTL